MEEISDIKKMKYLTNLLVAKFSTELERDLTSPSLIIVVSLTN